jgi:molybdopterin-guanine dinucleotide biosynthesis protein A
MPSVPIYEPRPPDLLAIVLAGGASRRMGTDKRWLEVGGESLLARALRFAASFADITWLAVDARFDAATVLSDDRVHLFRDPLAYAGPLAALAALPDPPAESVAVIACDLPALPADLFARLAAMLGAHPDAQVAVPCHLGRMEPLAALYRARVWPHLRRAAGQNERSLSRWLNTLGPRAVLGCGPADLGIAPAQWEGSFANWNTPADVAAGRGCEGSGASNPRKIL